MWPVLTLIVIYVLQVSATEECVGPMKVTQEPIQVRAIKKTSGITLLVCKLGWYLVS